MDSGSVYAGTVVSAGTWNFFTAVRLGADDESKAFTTKTSYDVGVLRNFDFSGIPAGATIVGIIVAIDLAPSISKVVLQIFDRVDAVWKDLVENAIEAADVDFDLEALVSADLDHYYDEDGWISCRVYQADL